MNKEIKIPVNQSRYLPFTNVAQVGDIVEFYDRKHGNLILNGRVIFVLGNSVIADLTIMENFNSLNLDYEKTVVSHRSYKILKVPVA